MKTPMIKENGIECLACAVCMGFSPVNFITQISAVSCFK